MDFIGTTSGSWTFGELLGLGLGIPKSVEVVWAAVFQLAGAALWVPASLPELQPCLHRTSTWSVANLMAPRLRQSS